MTDITEYELETTYGGTQEEKLNGIMCGIAIATRDVFGFLYECIYVPNR